MEGLAMGRPLIATDIAGCRETIEEGVNGFLCRPKDALSLAEAMRRFIALSPEERATMGRAGREHCQKAFDEQTVIGMYRTILDAV
jgi:glycosyltransferase involved in cell wall biosynthesis